MIGGGGVLFVVVFVGLAVAANFRGNSKARAAIYRWASSNSYTVASISFSWWGGRWFWRRSRSQRVYRVTIYDQAGSARTADIRCGNWLVGMLDDSVAVRWVN
jgi:hypothetical protein